MYSLINKISAPLGTNGGTTSPVDMTGATLFVVSLSWYGTAEINFFDSDLGHDWFGLTVQFGTGTTLSNRLWYCYSPTPYSGTDEFTFTGSGIYSSITAAGFTGNKIVSPYSAVQSGSLGSASTRAVGSLTPPEDNCLVVAGLTTGGNAASAYTVSGFTVEHTLYSAGNYLGGGLAWQIQTAATVRNPTWAWGGDTIDTAGTGAIFLPASLSGNSSNYRAQQ